MWRRRHAQRAGPRTLGLGGAADDIGVGRNGRLHCAHNPNTYRSTTARTNTRWYVCTCALHRTRIPCTAVRHGTHTCTHRARHAHATTSALHQARPQATRTTYTRTHPPTQRTHGNPPLGAAKWMTLPSSLKRLTSSIAGMSRTFSRCSVLFRRLSSCVAFLRTVLCFLLRTCTQAHNAHRHEARARAGAGLAAGAHRTVPLPPVRALADLACSFLSFSGSNGMAGRATATVQRCPQQQQHSSARTHRRRQRRARRNTTPSKTHTPALSADFVRACAN